MSLPEPLIPVYSPDTGSLYRPDTAILCLAINYLAESKPELFGGKKICAGLRRDIVDFISGNADSSPYMIPILPFVHELLRKNGLAPFKDTRLAFLGGEDFFHHSVFGDGTAQLRGSFAAFRDFHESRNGNGLTADHAANVITKGKYDIVLSGNVMNYPEVPNVKSVFAACANISRKGGISVHALNYSHDHYDLILSAQFHKVCGQRQIHDVVPRKHPQGEGLIVDFIALRQTREVMLSDADLSAMERKRQIPPPTDHVFMQATEALFGYDRRGFARDNFAPGC